MKFLKHIIFVLILSVALLPLKSLAQGQADPCTAPEDPCPIDANLYFLFAAAVIVAAKKTYDYKKKQVSA